MPQNKIWIELEIKPGKHNKEHNEKQVELANALLKKLGAGPGFEMLGENLITGGPGSYETLADNGSWFNLDYLAK